MRETIDFGIDLGTTNSTIAVADGDDVVVVKNNDGWDYTPSAVWMAEPGVVHVGNQARNQVFDNPDNAHGEFKLEMGDARAVRTFQKAGVSLTPPQLSAEVLKSLRENVVNQRDEPPPDAAVITVPAAFTLNQCSATVEAAKLAGLTAGCPLLQEPNAAAFAYGLNDTSERAYWLVFDLGGGTFDAAVITKRDGLMQVLHHSGDSYLGGKLIDWAVVERLLAPAVARELGLGLSEFTRGNDAWRRNFAKLKGAAEAAKIALSRAESVTMTLEMLDAERRTHDIDYTLRRGELERLAEPFYVRAISHCRRALADGDLRPGDIDRLLLVGSATLAPGLRALLADDTHGLGIPIDHSHDPSVAVARGAALFAATFRREVPRRVAKPGEFVVDLVYDPVVSTPTPTVAGTIRGAAAVNWSGYTVRIENRQGKPPFTSPRIPVADDGTFTASLVVDTGATARFTVTLTDATGTPQRLSPTSFTITHRDVELPGMVLAHSLGVGTVDNTYTRMVHKNTPLPATTRTPFEITSALNRATADAVVRIPILEGDRDRADRNRAVGVLEIRPKDVRIDLPAGTEVEVTIDIEDFPYVEVVAEVPMVDAQFEATLDLSQVTAPDAATLDAELRNAESRLRDLRARSRDRGSTTARQRLDQLEAEGTLDSARDQVRAAPTDTGAAATGEQRLRDLHADLDAVEDELRLPELLEELDKQVTTCAELVDEYGNAEDRVELADLRDQVARATRGRDPVAVQKLLERGGDFASELILRSPDREYILFIFFRNNQDKLHPRNRVAALIREGEVAMGAGDRYALAAVNERLRRMLDRDDPDSVVWLRKGQ